MHRIGLVVTILAFALPTFAAGTVENRQVFSSAFGENRWVQMYTPEGYDPGEDDPYPTIYFLHGANDTYALCSYLIDSLDSLIAAGIIDPVVVVKPDGSGCDHGYWNGCGWVNSETQGPFEDFLVQDLIPWVETEYNVASVRGMRAIMGHSMGGFGAMHTALKNPELFLAVASHSSYLYFDDIVAVHRPLVIAEQTGPPPWTYDPNAGAFTSGGFLLAGGFSPNPSAPPYFLDYLLDPYGEVIPSVWDRWLPFDPARIIDEVPPDLLPEIYFDCGSADELFLYEFNVHFDAHLTALGIDHEWASHAGDHTNLIHQRVPVSLAWIDNKRLEATSTSRLSQEKPPELRLANQPNPVRESATVSFTLACENRVSLAVYDVSGRRVDTLVDGSLGAGNHRVPWDVRNVPAGVYFCRLQAGHHTETTKLVVSE